MPKILASHTVVSATVALSTLLKALEEEMGMERGELREYGQEVLAIADSVLDSSAVQPLGEEAVQAEEGGASLNCPVSCRHTQSCASHPTGAGKESAHVPKASEKDEKRLSFEGADSSDTSASQPAWTPDEMKPVLRSFADAAVQRDACGDAPAQAASRPTEGAEGKSTIQPELNAPTPGITAPCPLPPFQPPPLSDATGAKVDAAVDELLSYVDEEAYPLPKDERHLLKHSRDANGRVDVQVIIHGFSVHPENRWVCRAGNGVAESMKPATLQAASLGGLEEGAKVVFLDIHLEADHWKAGGSLKKWKMDKMARHTNPKPIPGCPQSCARTRS